MQQSILKLYPDEDIQIIIVWIKMYEADSIEASQLAADRFGTDRRVIQFYDPGKLLGLEIAGSFGAEADRVAWDIYLFYSEEEKWVDRAPQPIDWAHQMLGSSWADPGRLHRGDELSRKLQEIMGDLKKDSRAV